MKQYNALAYCILNELYFGEKSNNWVSLIGIVQNIFIFTNKIEYFENVSINRWYKIAVTLIVLWKMEIVKISFF